jgi:FkbM family methyltransferase
VDVVEVRIGSTTVRARERTDARYGAFWSTIAAGGFEPATVSVLEQRLGPGRTFVDMGAWIGPFTLLAAALGADVVAFEVDPAAVAELAANVAANPTLADRIDVRAQAVAATSGTVTLDGGSVGLGNGLTRVRRGGRGARTDGPTVAAVGAAALMADERVTRAALVKIDIEGAEFAVVPRLSPWLRASRPAVLLSLHGADPGSLGGRGRSLLARALGAPKRVRLLWALREHPLAWRAVSNRADAWQPLGLLARAMLVFRLGEIELLFATDR